MARVCGRDLNLARTYDLPVGFAMGLKRSIRLFKSVAMQSLHSGHAALAAFLS